MSSSNCCFLTCIQISQEADQVVWYSHLFQNFPEFVVIYTVKGFGIVNKAEVDVLSETLLLFLWFNGCWQLISGSSAFSKTSVNIRKFTIHILLKDLHDLDNHDGVITHLEPDILECEGKWALERITTNKASRGDGIPVELFQILKDDARKVLHSICQQIWNLSSGHRTGKSQFSFQSQRKAMPKNAQTTAQLHSSHTLVK